MFFKNADKNTMCWHFLQTKDKTFQKKKTKNTENQIDKNIFEPTHRKISKKIFDVSEKTFMILLMIEARIMINSSRSTFSK